MSSIPTTLDELNIKKHFYGKDVNDDDCHWTACIDKRCYDYDGVHYHKVMVTKDRKIMTREPTITVTQPESFKLGPEWAAAAAKFEDLEIGK